MHDHKKSDRKVLTDEQKQQFLAAEKAKGELYQKQFTRYRQCVFTEDALKENEALLSLVPEAYSMYNYRREILCALWASDEKAQATENAKEGHGEHEQQAPARDELADLVTELKLNGKILERDFKIYAAFVHRHWVFEQLARRAEHELEHHLQEKEGEGTETPSSAVAVTELPAVATLHAALTKEASKCELLLKLDERNFHVWNHRRWAMDKLREAEERMAAATAATISTTEAKEDGAQREKSEAAAALPAGAYACLFSTHGRAEMAYTTQKIRSNFSNYSAWHQRALTIQRALPVHVGKDGAVTLSFPSSAATATTTLTTTLSGSDSTLQSDADAAAAAAAAAAGVLALLQEDLYFLTQAIYCDPNDQSAWFYAPFLLQLYHALRLTCPNMFLKADKQEKECSGDRYTGMAIEEAFLAAVFDLIAEERKLEEVECYLPHYFLYTRLATLVRCASSSLTTGAIVNETDREKVKETIDVCARLAKAKGSLPSAPEEKSAVFRLAHGLYSHLVVADELRKGLYDELWKVFESDF